jgi:hypothetical protein
MPDETPEPTFHLIPNLIVVGSAVLFGFVAALIYRAF